jgi:osmotically-inducible protein OsmY
MILIRILLFPIKLVLHLLGFTLKVGYVAGRMPVKASARTARLVGFRGWLFLIVGVAAGLLLAPESGRELRLKLQALIEGGGTSDAELAEKVTFELAHAPRTWHLDQPDVSVASGRVTLRGSVPGDDARDELARVAGAIPGVSGVENLVTVSAVASELS